jgi:hypothetical protein
MRYTITDRDELVVIFGSGQDEFELSLDKGALCTLVQLGADALTELNESTDELSDEPVTPGTSTA